MKIAIIGTKGIPARHGGFETFAERLAISLVRAGHEVIVYGERISNQNIDSYKEVKLVYLPNINMGPLTTIIHDTYALFSAAHKRVDVVYLLGYGMAISGLINRIAGQVLLINMDGIEWQREKWNYFPAKLWFRCMELVAVKIANYVIADSESIKQFLLSRHEISKDIFVIEYGTDLPNQDKQPIRLDQIGYLIVARIEPENMIREIITGFLQSRSKYILNIVGNCKANQYGRNILKEFGNSERLRFHGAIYNRQELNTMRIGALAHIHGHKVGGTNPSLLEAMAFTGLVVAHDNVHNNEVLGELGLYFNTPEDIARILREIEESPLERITLVRHEIRKRVAGKYSWQRICDLYLELFRKIYTK